MGNEKVSILGSLHATVCCDSVPWYQCILYQFLIMYEYETLAQYLARVTTGLTEKPAPVPLRLSQKSQQTNRRFDAGSLWWASGNWQPGLLNQNSNQATDWTTEKCYFNPSKGKDFPVLCTAEISSAAHVASYPVVTEGLIP